MKMLRKRVKKQIVEKEKDTAIKGKKGDESSV